MYLFICLLTCHLVSCCARLRFESKHQAGLREELRNPKGVLFEVVTGPLNSGKSRMYGRALEGRDNFIYISLRGAMDNIMEAIFYQAGTFSSSPKPGYILFVPHTTQCTKSCEL